MNPWLQRLIAAVLIIAFFVGVFRFSLDMMSPVHASPAPITVDIPLGANSATIAHRLKRAGLIRSEWLFQLVVRLYGESKNMKAGQYRIPGNRGIIQIIDQLADGKSESRWVVIPEGKTVPQVARLLASRRLGRPEAFLRAARQRPSQMGLAVPVSRRSVEGYLMPDSYEFPTQVSEPALIRRMLRNWNRKVYLANRARFAKSDLPVDKIVVIASMIEEEAKVPEDRPLISGVIRNRLANRMKLQIDATVEYALGHHKEELSLADLKVKSPYNTYLKMGLPPGPICNPGLASVEAALQPAHVDYLYYVAKPDGSHIFSRTAEEHMQAIARVKQMKRTSPDTARAAGR